MVISVIGNVGSVRTFTGEDGRKTVVFSVAVDQRAAATGSDGAKQAPIWYYFRTTNGLAEVLSQYLNKGRLVYVTGTSPRLRSYEVERSLNVAGVGLVKFKDVKQEVEYLVADFRFLDAPATNPTVVEAQLVTPAQQAAQTAQATVQPAQQVATQATPQTVSVEDLPF